MTDVSVLQKWEDAVTAMTKPENRFDVTIVCTTDDHQAEFWMSQLSSLIGSPEQGDGASKFPMVIAVSEDWNSSSGAGNGLGTLYAWQKAVAYAKQKDESLDLTSLLLDGTISAALYHTAGKGTRLAPLPASENNNKPGVKLPFFQSKNGRPWTVLEAVVQQTGIYAPSRKGRLSVFWGDQVFVPSVDFKYTPTHHVDILCTLLGDSAPTAEEWTAQGLDKYGVIAVVEGEDKMKNSAAQVEKVDHATAVRMLEGLGTIGAVGPSLGSFSISGPMVQALCTEYATELAAKQDKFDTDPHFWMPLTLSEDDYVYLMTQKGIEESTSKPHYQRMTTFSKQFAEKSNDSMGLFGAVNVGKDACWWDYGQLKLYSKNSFLLLEDSTEAQLLRKFVGVTTTPSEDHSYVFDSTIGTTTNCKDSIVCCVSTKELSAEGALIVNCVAPKITAGKGAILYNLMSEEEIVATEGQVQVQVTTLASAGGDATTFVLKSRMDIDGGKAWKTAVEGNELSFEQVHANNKETNISKVETYRQDERARKRQKIGL